MFAVGFARIISAITYFDNSDDVNNLTAGLFGDSSWSWGLWDLIIAALALFAGWSLLSNRHPSVASSRTSGRSSSSSTAS